MSSSTGIINGQSPRLGSGARLERGTVGSEGPRGRQTRRPRAGREENELTKVVPKISQQMLPSVEDIPADVISDQELISLYDQRIPRSSISYDAVLRKAVALVKDKDRIENELMCQRSRNESLLALNKTIREKSVRLHAKAEQEEEFISNMLLKRIQKLKNDKEALALKYEQEEEYLTNDLTRKLSQLQNERDELAGQIEAEQSWVVDTLLVKIRKLEAEISANHKALEQLRREKVDLENALEHEQESLFNTLGKRMDQLEAEKRRMQARLDQASLSDDHSPASSTNEFATHEMNDTGERRSTRAEIEARKLREECSRQRNVITNLKATITTLQEQIILQETKYVADILAMREKSAEARANSRRARMTLETDLARCLETCRAFSVSEMVRENDEDKCMASLLNQVSIPRRITSTPAFTDSSSPDAVGASNADTDVSNWHTPSKNFDSQGEKMEEGSETADTDGDANMDASFFTGEREVHRNEDNERFDDESVNETAVNPSSASSNEESNDPNEMATMMRGQFARPALPAARSPVAKKDH